VRLPPSASPVPYTTLFRSDALFEGFLSRGERGAFTFGAPFDLTQLFEARFCVIESLRGLLLFVGEVRVGVALGFLPAAFEFFGRSEEHTSELQSRENLVCR